MMNQGNHPLLKIPLSRKSINTIEHRFCVTQFCVIINSASLFQSTWRVLQFKINTFLRHYRFCVNFSDKLGVTQNRCLTKYLEYWDENKKKLYSYHESTLPNGTMTFKYKCFCCSYTETTNSLLTLTISLEDHKEDCLQNEEEKK